MATFTKYYATADEISKGGHNFQTAVLKVALTNTAPTVATDTVWNTTVAPAPAAANGYTAGGNTITTSSAVTTLGIFKLILADSTFTASGGSLGPFRYAVIYNSSASDKLVASYDYGSSITLADGEALVVDFDGTAGLFTI